MEANALGVSVRFPTLSQPFAADTSLCVPSECGSVFLIPQSSLDTLNAVQMFSPEVLLQRQLVAGFCIRVTDQREQGKIRP